MLRARTLACIRLIGESKYVTVLLKSPFLSHAAGMSFGMCLAGDKCQIQECEEHNRQRL